MAAKSDSVWAIDIGSNSLKALHLSTAGGSVEVIGFDNIQHGKILTGSGVKPGERDELIALSLRQLAKQSNLGKDDVVISVPSQNSFARFVNLPPVEPKRIPEIVKFEATQQIPFDISDVQWDWQLMTEAGSPEAKVGIFAVKSDVVISELEHFSRENIQVKYVQMAPMALYNYLLHDRPDLVKSDNQATVILNIGAENTDLVVCTKSSVWQRCVPMGGNAFTRAIADTFKLNFEKAEKLKRTAAMSKYARQILQAMKPVFADLASEIQRSLGFYNSSNPDTKLTRIVALGGGTKMQGLLKYLQQTFQIPIERPDSFKKLVINSAVSAAKFHESVCDFGIVYGLALQGLGLAKLKNNLLPRSIARSMAWAGKSKDFTAAAVVLLVVSLMCLGRTLFDRFNYSRKYPVRQEISRVVQTAEQASSKLRAEKGKGAGFEVMVQKEFEAFKYRNVVPLLCQTIASALPNEKNNPAQKKLYGAFANSDLDTVLETPRKDRKQIFITSISAYFTSDIESVDFGSQGFEQRAKRRKAGPAVGGGEEESDVEMSSYYEGASAQQRSYLIRSAAGTQVAKQGESGFILTVTGYSPYKNIGELLDPAGVGDDRSKWGVITRLLHLDDIADGNSPFKLYKKTEIKHFQLKIGEVGVGLTDSTEMPAGIGLLESSAEAAKARKTVDTGENVLIDPMTDEIISKVPELNKDGSKKIDRSGKVVYEVNDRWFILNVKFVWKDAPKPVGSS
jgi:type IV pilus assembly protein PilM